MSEVKKETLVVGSNKKAEEAFKMKMNDRIMAFKELVKIANENNLEYDLKKLYKEPKVELEKAIRTTLGSEGILLRVSVQKLCDLFDIDLSLAFKAIAVFEKDENLTFNPKNFSYEVPSFDTVLRGAEKIKKYNDLLAVIESLGKFDNVTAIFIQRAFQGRIYVDTNTMELKPNLAILMMEK